MIDQGTQFFGLPVGSSAEKCINVEICVLVGYTESLYTDSASHKDEWRKGFELLMGTY